MSPTRELSNPSTPWAPPGRRRAGRPNRLSAGCLVLAAERGDPRARGWARAHRWGYRCAALAFGVVATACSDELDWTEPPIEPVGGVANSLATAAGDRAVLVALYEATNGPDWDESGNWLTDAPLNDWHGVGTDDHGRVQVLDLRSNNLEGEIPPELGNLANLVDLDLGWNKLEGEIPPELGNLANLYHLNLGNAGSDYWGDGGLEGEIPSEMGNLANLRHLILSLNDLRGEVPRELGSLANLSSLNLVGNRLDGGLPPEFAHSSLEFLYWGDNAGLCAPGTRRFISFLKTISSSLDLSPPDQGALCHEADAEVLRSVYHSTGGSAWTHAEGWLLPGPLDDWHGVEADTVFGRVVGLDLRENQLSGRLPTKLTALDSLRALRLDSNAQLGGRLPLGTTALPLQVLSYEGTNLCTPEDPSFRAWLRSIQSHSGTAIECPPLASRDVLEALFNATGGQNWRKSDNWLTDVPLRQWHGVETDGSGRIQSLDLGSNNLEGEIPSELGNLSNLENLDLGWNKLEGEIPSELGGLSNLMLLYLHGNDLEGHVPPELGGLSNLERLSLFSNDLEGKILPELGGLSNLSWLYLSDNNLEGKIPPELGSLSNLEHLYLSDNDLEGHIPSELGSLSNLEALGVSGSNLEGKIPPELGNLANLKRMSLSGNDLEGKIPSELGNLANLEDLYLSDNNLEGKIPPELGNLANLKRMSLSGNDLEGKIPSELGNLANLEDLYLSDNNLEGKIPPELGNLANLGSLHLSSNVGLSGALPRSFASMKRLNTLIVFGTALCAPEDFAFQVWLRSMSLTHPYSAVPYVPICKARAKAGTATAYIVQGVQSADVPVPLVAGRRGLLRVLVAAPDADSARVPAAWATFYQQDGSKHSVRVRSGGGTIPAEIEVAEGSLSRSANVEIPGEVLRPGVAMVVVLDPEGVLDPALGVPRRIPAAGLTALDVYEMPSFDVTVVPFLWETEPDSSILELVAEESLFDETRLLPIGEMSVTVHEPVWTSTNNGFDLLDETLAIRRIEGGTSYYMGTAGSFTGGIGGVALLGSRVMFSGPWPYTVAHEFGHNLSLWHAPCGTTGDPEYPHSNGRIGVWGYDHRSLSLVSPRDLDIMSYCNPSPGFSDYSFAKAFWWRMKVEAGIVEEYPARAALLVWGGVGADERPFLNPAFVVEAQPTRLDGTGAWQIAGEAEDGRVLFNRRIEMSETADGDGRSSFALALATEAGWADALSQIVLMGPDGVVKMNAESSPMAALLRDAATGKVRGILRNWSASRAAAQPGAAWALPEPGLEVQVSAGIPHPDAWSR